MAEIKDQAEHCRYMIITAPSLDELEIQVNELIARGWNEEGIPSGGWEIQGGIGFDGKNYFQAMINCPVQSATAARESSPNQS